MFMSCVISYNVLEEMQRTMLREFPPIAWHSCGRSSGTRGPRENQAQDSEAQVHQRRAAISQPLLFDLILPLMCVHHVALERLVFREGASKTVIKVSLLTGGVWERTCLIPQRKSLPF